MSNYSILSDENKVVLSVDPDCYSLESVYSACYRYLDSVYVFLKGDPKKEIKVELKPKENFSDSKLEDLAGNFSNELLNSGLRNKVAEKNEELRKYIVSSVLLGSSREMKNEFLNNEAAGESFSEAEDQDGGNQELDEDPLDIATPWEEKYEDSDENQEE